MRGTRESRRGRVRLGSIAARIMVAAGTVLAAAWSAPAAAQDQDDPADLMAGMEIFNGGCNSCHGNDGAGSAVGRSLIDIAVEEPDRAVHVERVTNGFGDMPAFGDRLTADEIDAAVTYVRLTFVSDGSDLAELPNTGQGPLVVMFGLLLIAAGAAALVASDVRRGTVRCSDRRGAVGFGRSP